jgi:urate oxidase
MPVIRASSHGESRVRMVRIVRRGDRHDPRDLSVSCRFEGSFAAAFQEGRADGLLPGETLKNIVYGVARDHGSEEIELFGLALCDRLLTRHEQITRVRVEVSEQRWSRLEAGGKAQGQTFAGGSGERRTAAVTSNGKQVAVVAGVEDLALMRTSGFAPAGGRHVDHTGASDGLQRLLVATLAARWTYTSADVTFASYRQGVRATIVDTFAWHASQSVQHTLYNIADVVLASYQEISEITLALHERPYRPADLFKTGVENPDELFVALDEPLGIVEVTVERE